MMPAMRAACSGSPFFTAPRRIWRRASADIRIDPRATASRVVTGLPPTSTIFTRPRASTCVSVLLPPAPAAPPRPPRLLAIAVGQEEGQALERDGQVDALELHVGRDL